MNKHTKGPWKCSPVLNMTDTLIIFISTDNGDTEGSIAQTRGQTTGQEEECMANAKLMVASPDMLEALKACIYLLRDLPTLNGLGGLAVLENAKEAVRKAEGKSLAGMSFGSDVEYKGHSS